MNLENLALLSFYKDVSPLADHPHVMLVRHIETETFYVKKTLSPEYKEIYKFLQSSPVPGVPKVILAVEDDQEFIVIEEYVNGSSLDVCLRRNGVFSEQDAIHITLQLCHTLKALHSCTPPVIHRDIKPSNVIITSDLTPWLIDFDAAKTYHAARRRDTTMLGTVEHAAPEQYGFAQSDARTDIFALGILLNLMLTGRFPYECPAAGSLSRVIRTCTQIDPSNRYQSVAALEKALLKIQAHDRHKTSGSSPEPSVRRHPFAPPGFRSGTPWKMILAVLGYAFILWMSATLELEDATIPFTTVMGRIFTFFIFISWIMIFANYGEICRHLLLARSSNLLVSLAGRFLWCLLITLTFLVLLGLITVPFDPGFLLAGQAAFT